MGWKASAPASLMVCGEHAVVQGFAALVAAIDERVSVSLVAREDGKIVIQSALAQHETDVVKLESHPALGFVMACIKQLQPTQGFDLTIISEINPTMGFGSSAAVVAATIAVLALHTGKQTAQSALAADGLLWLHQEGLTVIRAVQGRGSGADLAAALAGGLVAYEPARGNALTQVPSPKALWSVRYAGYKTKTADVLAMLAERAAVEPKRFADLYTRMGQVSAAAILAAQASDWEAFYAALNHYQTLMAELGVCDAVQAAQIAAAQATSFAVKISGSGLGDCILAWSEALPAEHQMVRLSDVGLQIEML